MQKLKEFTNSKPVLGEKKKKANLLQAEAK